MGQSLAQTGGAPRAGCPLTNYPTAIRSFLSRLPFYIYWTMPFIRTLLEPCSSRTAALLARRIQWQRGFCSSAAKLEKKGEQPQTVATDNIELPAVCQSHALLHPFTRAKPFSDIKTLNTGRTDDSPRCISHNRTTHGLTFLTKTGQLLSL